jgi:hypothetical protein
MKFYLFSLALLMLITNIEINWLFSSIKESSFDIGFIVYYLPSTFIIPCSTFDILILNTSQILCLLRKLACVI